MVRILSKHCLCQIRTFFLVKFDKEVKFKKSVFTLLFKWTSPGCHGGEFEISPPLFSRTMEKGSAPSAYNEGGPKKNLKKKHSSHLKWGDGMIYCLILPTVITGLSFNFTYYKEAETSGWVWTVSGYDLNLIFSMKILHQMILSLFFQWKYCTWWYCGVLTTSFKHIVLPAS